MNYLYEEDKILENGISSIQNDTKLSNRNRELILQFKDHLLARGVTKIRVGSFYFHKLRKICNLANTDLDKFTKEDVEKVMAVIESSNYSPSTKDCYKICFKVFFRWLYKIDRTEPTPKIVNWLEKVNAPNRLKKEDLLTHEETERMINATKNMMHKAIISCLAEGGLRPGELRGMTIKDCIFSENKIKVYVRGKMKKKQGDRVTFLYKSYDILRRWLESHPHKNNPNSFVWVCNGENKPISDINLRKLVERTATNAGIKKRVYPYIFRHTRATELYGRLGEALAKKFLGHAEDSRMAKVYNHLNEEDLEKGLDTLAGIVKKEETQRGIICPRCGKPDGNGSICSNCGLLLSVESAIRYENSESVESEFKMLKEFAKMISSNPRFMDIIRDPNFIQYMAEQRVKEIGKS